ncbi:hypothetical protein IMSHALPRED_006926 [Imshaugia aleurites]|uniref:Uncharacterized protein n=1 Tax=Imshaugia aleurites TaxID=172621 RepID=A0A8H3IP53_9LECA|nr:hypothetical protein IMSHALPRED_006926 [Imshaugia aleurites]
MATGVGSAKANFWSRAARRKQQQRPTDSSDKNHVMKENVEDEGPALGIKV